MKPVVSFIIPTYNEAKTIKKCLESLKGMFYPTDKIDIIVIDGGSSDRTVSIVKEFENVRLFTNNNLNLPMSRNKGLEEAKGEYVFNYNGHVVAEPELLNVILSKFREDIDVVGCPNITPDQEGLGRYVGKLSQGFMAGGGTDLFLQNARFKCDRLVDHLPFCCYKKKVIDDVGMFDKNMEVGEDAEYNIRVRQHGYKILYTPDTYVKHYKPTTLKSLFKKMYSYGMARSKIIKKHPNNKSILNLLPTIALATVSVLLFLLLFNIISLMFIAKLLLIYLILCIVSAVVVGGLDYVTASIVVYPVIHLGYVLGMIKGYLEVKH